MRCRSYRSENKSWIILAGDNYGEGSSREVAAMSPRYMGGFGVVAKSMARIHETVSSRDSYSVSFRFCQRGLARPDRGKRIDVRHIELEETGCFAFILRR